jgi:hypothetical protein
MKKIFTGIFVIIILLSLTNITYAYEPELNGNNESDLEITLDVNGSYRKFQIKTKVTNLGDEPINARFSCMPGGGYEVYNKNNKKVYFEPMLVWWTILELYLEPGETKTLYSDVWFGRNMNGFRLPSGEYSIIGFAYMVGGKVSTDPIYIKIPKTRDRIGLDFLDQFPLLERLLSLLS